MYHSNAIIYLKEDMMRTLLVITDLALIAAPLLAVMAPLFAAVVSGVPAARPPTGTIAFSSLAPRGWRLYLTDVQAHQSRRLTDHAALDYNAVFSPDGRQVALVSERDGNMELYTIRSDGTGLQRLTNDFALDDHPTWSPDGKQIAFVSTRQPAATPGQAWNAVYVMNVDGSGVQRLSPTDAADYSPAWSPKGDLIAFASGSGKAGDADLFVMKPDGSGRKLIVKNGGWPSFAADGQNLFFHSQREGEWGVWRVNLNHSQVERITPPDVEAFTPRASADGKWLVVAVRRGSHRQIELMDLNTRKQIALTNDATDHWNPSISADGMQVIYHKAAPDFVTANAEVWGAPPGTRLNMLRVDGAFPTFSPEGKRLAFVGDGFAHLAVMNIDGSSRKTLYTGGNRDLFSVSWGHSDQIAFAAGGVFQGPKAEVDLMVVRPDGSGLRKLTWDVGNNGFPAFSPDGKQLVFRSGREGFKNLYIINSDGAGLMQLTKGEWTDTMCNWSLAGDWIAFASNHDGNFDIWLIRPDGSGLHKIIGGGGRNNHPHFSPDGKWLVFTSQRAGYSAEEISLPFQYQPYGDLFGVRLDGTGLVRLTHNGFEEGTPAWGPGE
jgi:Tol biopolymer transport system component